MPIPILRKFPSENIASGRRQKNSWFLELNERDFFLEMARKRRDEGKPQVLWGWKRDKVIDRVRYPESRTVYFSADLDLNDEGILFIKRAYFFLDTRAKTNEIESLKNKIGKDKKIGPYDIQITSWQKNRHPGYSRLRLEAGRATEYDKKTVTRRLKGKPRLSIDPPRLVPETQDYDISKYAPFALCAGSGLSAESGLPLLGEIHNIFEVDNVETEKLIFGAEDDLPERIVDDAKGEFKKFCQFTVDAIKAKPSKTHHTLAGLYKKGIIRQIFTDNMDDLLKKINVPYTQTRLSIFPDRYPVKFDPEIKTLLVLGVAVDRRDVIKQARHKGLKIVAVNPVFGVAPHSRNMDYLRKGDIFFREEASQALPKVISASGF
ncbi:hypothetical protein KAT60_00730 [Candidatus Woesebacteria bacterium]|nr:hypothetical protein [Candidatus Woesebacteria bacterium]